MLYDGVHSDSLKGHSLERTPLEKGRFIFLAASTYNAFGATCHLLSGRRGGPVRKGAIFLKWCIITVLCL